ncbi:hypothetical protein BVRB_040890 [Beta vulgaris subsp. vulgaris]|uniref:Uncharacterized protein n=1 Tax=Beta vulgaris subsp. vulgaris TaxID=3555 RepID=A0A0J7YP96_BETVV|nr:hypothetical protein BVRB_040890 [Beta vulgaris subsp. vulgaris]
MFTRGAVLAAKNDPQQITVKPTAAALCWIQQAKYQCFICIPNRTLISFRPSVFTPIKEVVYLNNETVQQLQQEVQDKDGREGQSIGIDSEASKESMPVSDHDTKESSVELRSVEGSSC